ncbi:MAG: sugar porter family MFS transporter [Clostridiales bacterium]|nr:sugar porter family MFS transporter [Clostridiales bacterium]
MERNSGEILTDYKKCTEDIIEILKKGDFDSLQDKMKIRQGILNELISNNNKKIEARKVYEKLNIEETENEARKLMKEKTLSIKEKLRNISVNKTASSAYGSVGNSAKIFSKKI